ncbi:MAG: dihydrolipoamide dehydrogenase [Geminicoccaceae bacterium]|nr:MAG: dihydrolipoamide dehydrogenase [Geminicoccaceae bacterium]
MTDVLTPDLCVVGGGSGGLTLAAGAVQMGASVVLVEAERMGGDCLNVGCVPSKALLAAARRAQAIREAGAFGIAAGEPEIDFARVMDRVRDVIAQIAPHDSVERFEGLGVKVILARGRFTGPAELEAGGYRIRARRFVLATGSRPAVPPIPGLSEVPYLTNETVFENRVRPTHLLVLGAGPIGCELAQAHRRLGSAVTLVDIGPLLPREDPALVALLRQRFLEEGIVVRERVEVRRVEPGPVLVIAGEGGEERIAGSHLLLATGRRPTVEGLGLEAAGIRYAAKGIEVDRRLRTSNPRVYAIGDCTGGPQFTHLAGWQAGQVLKTILFRLPAGGTPPALPRVTFTDPELASVGLLEAEARAQGLEVRRLGWSFADNDRARAERSTIGRIEAVVGRRGRILGVSILGPHAGELLLPWVLAIERGLRIGALATTLAPYPTLSEVTKRVAGSWYTPTLFGERTRRLVRWLAKLG